MAKHKKHKESATVFMRPKSKSHRLGKVLLSAIGAVCLVVIVVALVYGLQHKKSKTPVATIPQTKSQQAQSARLSGDNSKAAQIAKQSLQDSSLSSSEKSDLYVQLAATYAEQKNYQAALNAYDKSTALKPVSGVFELEADLAMQMDNKQQAIAYYKKAIKYLPANDARRDANAQYYQQKIDALESGK